MPAVRAIRFLVASAFVVVPSLGDAQSIRPLKEKEWTRAHAAHLLARAGFSGAPQEIDRLAAIGLKAAVDELVGYGDRFYEPAPPPFDELVLERPDRHELQQKTESERQAFQQKLRELERDATEETRLWWIERMIESPRPLEEKMTLFWHGHFTSGIREVRNPVFMREQNEFLRRHALDSFRELLIGISRDRAMLIYLDGAKNNKSRPNENYARELLELFTLGVGNYGEDDIKAAARAFTGWTVDRDGFRFATRNHDYGQKTFLGKTGALNGEDIIDIVLQQPACSRFLARNLLEFFVRPDPEKRLVEGLAAEIRRNDYAMAPTMRTLLMSEAFYAPESRGALIKSPVELVVSTARRLGVRVENLRAAERAMTAMGQELMQPPNVKGWDGNQAWINTATLFTRYNLVGAMINGYGGPPAARGSDKPGGGVVSGAAPEESNKMGGEMANPMMMRAGPAKPRSRLEGQRQPPYDPMPTVRAARADSAEAIVDYYESNLLSTPLADRKHDALVTYLLNGREKFDLSHRDAADRIRTMIHLMCSTPEFQLF